MRLPIITTLSLLALASSSIAGEADVVKVSKIKSGNGTWNFSVTVKHSDEGWDHFANKWEVVAPDGTVLGVRKLAHPHVQEQPFTRSQGGIKIPDGMKEVIVRAHDSVHGFGGEEMTVAVE